MIRVIFLLSWFSLIACSTSDKLAGTSDETETGVPQQSNIQVILQNPGQAARIFVIRTDSSGQTEVIALEQIKSKIWRGNISSGSWHLWIEDGDKQYLSPFTLSTQSLSFDIEATTSRALNLPIQSNPTVDLSNTQCFVQGTTLATTLVLIDSTFYIQEDVPAQDFVLECITEAGVPSSQLIPASRSPADDIPLILQMPAPVEPVQPEPIIPTAPIPLDTFIYEVPHNHPTLTRPAIINIPANRDVYNFTAIKVAKEPKTWLAIRLWSEGGHYLEIPGGLWGQAIPVEDADGDGRLWLILEPQLAGEADMPVQFDWW
jgi:hypothetical protein